MVAQNLDRIEKQIVLRASRSRVWRALTDAREFGTWFGLRLDGPFQPHTKQTGQLSVGSYAGLKFELEVEQIEPESYFSYRWHPYAIDPQRDYSAEPTTLVEFRLEEVAAGTRLQVTESGFEHIPLARRAEALRMNDGGWAEQLRNIERYVSA